MESLGHDQKRQQACSDDAEADDAGLHERHQRRVGRRRSAIAALVTALLDGRSARMPAAETWLLGGPVDGRLMPIEINDSGGLPDAAILPQTGVYLGTSDSPDQAVKHRYVRGPEFDP
jgi:hypothetical protein